MPPKYDKGDLITCSVEIRNSAGTLTDPTTVTFKTLSPCGTSSTYVYGTDTEVAKSGTGIYTGDLDANEGGQWTYRWETTGDPQIAEERQIEVDSSVF